MGAWVVFGFTYNRKDYSQGFEKGGVYWAKQTIEKRIYVSFAKHGWENLRMQISQRGYLNSLMPREFASMMGRCILQMDYVKILKRIFCIYKGG